MSVERARQGPLQSAVRLLGVVHPLLFAAAYVLERFAGTNTAIPELWRPLLVAILVAGALTLGLWAILRNPYAAAMVASAILLAAAFHPIPALILVGLILWWAGTSVIRRRRGLAPRAVGTGSLVVQAASAYAVVLLVAALFASLPAFTLGVAQRPSLPAGGDSAAGPDIYLLLLDGYPRGDTLATEFGHDNSAFELELADLGFEVAPDALADHNKTWLTVATMLNGQYVTDIPEIADPPGDAPGQVRLLHTLINDGAVLDVLQARGYTVRSIPSPVMSTDVTADAEVWWTPHLNAFEIALVSASAPAFIFPDAVLDFLSADARGLIVDQLDAFAATASQPGPQLVLAHAMAPHPPFVLGGELDYLRDCFPACKVWETTLEETGMTANAYAAHLRSQVEALNHKVIATLSQIVEDDPEAIVIVMSDHGARIEADATDEHFRILFAARTPGLDGLFADDQAPVNIFRRILSSTAFDEDLPDLPYRSWASDWFAPLKLGERR